VSNVGTYVIHGYIIAYLPYLPNTKYIQESVMYIGGQPFTFILQTSNPITILNLMKAKPDSRRFAPSQLKLKKQEGGRQESVWRKEV
jgi:hypothetical protein